MTHLARENLILRARVEMTAAVSWLALRTAIVNMILLLPLALLTKTGIWYAIGMAWAIGYLVVMAIPSALFILIATDAICVLTGRDGFFAARIGAARPEEGEAVGTPAQAGRLPLLGRLVVTSNPLAPITVALTMLAYFRNPAGFHRMITAAFPEQTQPRRRTTDVACERPAISTAVVEESLAWRHRRRAAEERHGRELATVG